MKCNNCGHDLTDKDGKSMIGMQISVKADDQHPEAIRFKQRYGVTEINVCLCCLVQGLGLRRSTYMETT
jgi:hypothetical protein